MSTDGDWRKELGEQRVHYEPTETMLRDVWALLLDATNGLELADYIIRKAGRPTLRAIVAEWLSNQDFADAMSGVGSDG